MMLPLLEEMEEERLWQNRNQSFAIEKKHYFLPHLIGGGGGVDGGGRVTTLLLLLLLGAGAAAAAVAGAGEAETLLRRWGGAVGAGTGQPVVITRLRG